MAEREIYKIYSEYLKQKYGEKVLTKEVMAGII